MATKGRRITGCDWGRMRLQRREEEQEEGVGRQRKEGKKKEESGRDERDGGEGESQL